MASKPASAIKAIDLSSPKPGLNAAIGPDSLITQSPFYAPYTIVGSRVEI